MQCADRYSFCKLKRDSRVQTGHYMSLFTASSQFHDLVQLENIIWIITWSIYLQDKYVCYFSSCSKLKGNLKNILLTNYIVIHLRLRTFSPFNFSFSFSISHASSLLTALLCQATCSLIHLLAEHPCKNVFRFSISLKWCCRFSQSFLE